MSGYLSDELFSGGKDDGNVMYLATSCSLPSSSEDDNPQPQKGHELDMASLFARKTRHKYHRVYWLTQVLRRNRSKWKVVILQFLMLLLYLTFGGKVKKPIVTWNLTSLVSQLYFFFISLLVRGREKDIWTGHTGHLSMDIYTNVWGSNLICLF